jgi:hypothetical protein
LSAGRLQSGSRRKSAIGPKKMNAAIEKSKNAINDLISLDRSSPRCSITVIAAA